MINIPRTIRKARKSLKVIVLSNENKDMIRFVFILKKGLQLPFPSYKHPSTFSWLVVRIFLIIFKYSCAIKKKPSNQIQKKNI
jgi:hypothetical protein